MGNRFITPVAGVFLSALALLWRRLMFRTTFIAVTGSLGKTSATRMLADALASRYPTNSTRGANNSRLGLAQAVLRTRPRHRYSVLEVGTQRPGSMRRAAWMLNPNMVVLLNVARSHVENFNGLDAIAREKARLASRMGPGGTLIVNCEDPRTQTIGAAFGGSVRTFGTSGRCDVWASDVASRWPGRLEFTVHAGGESRRVRTRLVGEQWLSSALAALSAALACGMDLDAAAAGIATTEPYLGRMQPAPLPCGAVMLRDEFNPSPDSWLAALRVMADAEAERKWVAIGDLDEPGVPVEQRMTTLGSSAAGVMDCAVFFGEHSALAARGALAAGMKPDSVHSFPSQREAGDFLNGELRRGDLVLLRSVLTDHPERIYFAQFGSVDCTRLTCRLMPLCDVCPHLHPGLERIGEVPVDARPNWRPSPPNGT